MRSRSEELRRRNRKILTWSIGAAALIHIAVFVLSPEYEVEPFMGSTFEAGGDSTATTGIPLVVDVLFGPPDIALADGSYSPEPPERVLETDRLLSLPTECSAAGGLTRSPAMGRVRLVVNDMGQARVVGITESTGDACGDEVLSAIAGALLYRWLPSERFPAPVDVIQPITIENAAP